MYIQYGQYCCKQLTAEGFLKVTEFWEVSSSCAEDVGTDGTGSAAFIFLDNVPFCLEASL